jgi:DNA-binding transcriptional MerR regulator
VKTFEEEGLKRLTMEEASHVLRIPRHTLRFWEKEFDGFLIPSGAQGKQRRFGPDEISLIGTIKKLRSRGKTLPEIKRQLKQTSGEGPLSAGDGLAVEKSVIGVKADPYRFCVRKKGTEEFLESSEMTSS